MKGQSMNYLSPPYANSECDSIRSCSSICSSISSAPGVGEVHVNAAYDNLESGDMISSSNHDYEDLQSIRTDVKELPAKGRRSRTNELYEPTGRLSERAKRIKNGLNDEDLHSIRTDGHRSKDNDLYEPTGPMKHRVRQITECSDDSNASLPFTDAFLWKKDSCLSKLILFLILAFSVAALVLVILIIYGTVGPKCGCKDLHSGMSLHARACPLFYSFLSIKKRKKNSLNENSYFRVSDSTPRQVRVGASNVNAHSYTYMC